MSLPPFAGGSLPIDIQSRWRAESFAAVAMDAQECVVVMDTLWFRQSVLEPQWEHKVMETLHALQVVNVYVPFGAMSLKKAADERMNVIMAEKPFVLKYACQCHQQKACAVTKAYLNWPQHAKRQACNLQH